MALVKYNVPVTPASPVDRLASEIFGQSIGRFLGGDGYQEHAPRVNITERAEEFVVEMQAPGFDKKDLHVEMLDDTLTIRGERTEEGRTNEEERYTRREFTHNAFERSFVLPNTVNGEAIKADYSNGVLRLNVPKKEESKPKKRMISIR
ncbi:MAG: Hsp20/alpha crystallin family protein [Flavobacteriales bacterium]|nr:Hsp20/alpha crystallin family protein [Flavobacteriales bacterium]